MTNRNKQERKALVFGYLATPEENRLPVAKFLKSHKMQRRTFYNLEGEYKTEKLSLTKREREDQQEGLKNTVMDAWDVVEGREPPKRTKSGKEIAEISDDEETALKRRVYDDAVRKGASKGDKELAIRMLGMLIEKQEVTHKLSADEITRRNLEAERQLRAGGYRVVEVQKEPSLLSE